MGNFAVSVGASSYFKGISEHFGFDKCYHANCAFDIDFGPLPRFIRKTLEETDRYRIERDKAGIVKKTLLIDVSIPGWVDFPLKSRADFEEIKKRYDPEDLRRYPKNWGDELLAFIKETNPLLGITIPGFFGQPRSFMGLERLIRFMFKEKDLIHEILDFWERFIVETLREPVKQIGFDYAYIWEDMCYVNGPLISPRLFEEYILPHYKRVNRFLKEHDVKIIIVDSDGDCRKLIPLLIEGGVDCLTPLEIQSFMDPVKLREEFGKSFLS
ncbi:MAG: uroporphyrinogen decarboxylase family protein [Nitrososphaeria archaeon]